MAYSDAEITEAMIRLAINKYDYKLTASQIGISEKTLRRWDKNATKKGVPDLLNRAIERMLMVIPDKWNGQDWAIALGIMIDKWLLMQGEPTSRVEAITRHFGNLSEDELNDVLAEADQILEEAASRGPDQGAGSK